MTSVFKRRGDRTYTIAWMDAQGRRRERSTRTTDKKTAELIAAKVGSSVALRREGIIDQRQDRLTEQGSLPLVEHVRGYVRHCLDSEQARVTVTEKCRHLAWLLCETDWRTLLPPEKRREWAADQRTQPKDPASAKPRAIPISRRVPGPGWTRLSDVRAEGLERTLGLLREAGLSARACNFKREVAIAFAGWCVKSGRLDSNPLLSVQRLDANRDQRRVRRALSDEEMARLFAVAEKRGRKLWYMLAALAGLRRSEIAGLTWADVDLQTGSLTITRGKAKRSDALPLDPALADELRQVKPALCLPSARVFASEVTNATRRRDFKRARIKLVDEFGAVADLHGLRTTLGTRLSRAGIAPQIAQRLMRHSDYRTTLRHYTRLTLDDSAAALSRLAPIESKPAEEQRARKTGSDDADLPPTVPHDWPQKRPHSGHETARSDASDCEITLDETDASDVRKSASDAELSDDLRELALAHPAGFEPTTLGSEDRYSIR